MINTTVIGLVTTIIVLAVPCSGAGSSYSWWWSSSSGSSGSSSGAGPGPTAKPPGPGNWCKTGWIGGYERSCFKIMSTPATWDQADGICKELGGKLVVLDTEKRTAFVAGVLSTANLQNEGWWIGGRRINKILKWQGSPGVWYGMSYTNWYSGQPDNYGGNEDCVQIVRNESPPYGWNDNECSVTMPFICEAIGNGRK